MRTKVTLSYHKESKSNNYTNLSKSVDDWTLWSI